MVINAEQHPMLLFMMNVTRFTHLPGLINFSDNNKAFLNWQNVIASIYTIAPFVDT